MARLSSRATCSHGTHQARSDLSQDILNSTAAATTHKTPTHPVQHVRTRVPEPRTKNYPKTYTLVRNIRSNNGCQVGDEASDRTGGAPGVRLDCRGMEFLQPACSPVFIVCSGRENAETNIPNKRAPRLSQPVATGARAACGGRLARRRRQRSPPCLCAPACGKK